MRKLSLQGCLLYVIDVISFSLNTRYQFHDNLYDSHARSNGNTSTSGGIRCELPSLPSLETPPLPSFGVHVDHTLIQPPPAYQAQPQAVNSSPRSNGYLESIFYQPKTLEGSIHDPMKTQWDPNLAKEENLCCRDVTNPDALPDLGWLENNDTVNNDDYLQSVFKDGLFEVMPSDMVNSVHKT